MLLRKQHHKSRSRADGALDDVGVDLDAPVIDEAGQAFPARERVADGFGELGLLADQIELGAQPGLEFVKHRFGLLVSDGTALVGGAAAELALDGIELGDARQGLAGSRRGTGNRKLVEAPSHMGPAEGERHVATFGKSAIAAIAVRWLASPRPPFHWKTSRHCLLTRTE